MIKGSIVLVAVSVLLTCVSCTPLNNSAFDVHSMLAIFPQEKIKAIEQNHFKNDEGFRAALFYLQSKEWRDLVEIVIKKPEYQQFVKMAKKYDIDVLQLITCIREHIDSLKVPEKPAAKPDLEPYINEVQAVIPISAIAQTVSELLGSEEGKRIRDEISSEENRKIADSIHNLPEMVKLREIMKGMNLDVEPYIALVYTFLGWIN